jgi:type IV pilus assembly protein PilE
MIARRSSTARGFTLIELMITLVIAAILITIAVPSYRRYILRSQRTDATVALTRIQAAQEKYFLQYNRYAPALTPNPPGGLALPNVSDGGFYTIELTPGAMEYEAKATPREGSGQTADTTCQLFEVDHNSVKRASDGSGTDRTNECWR